MLKMVTLLLTFTGSIDGYILSTSDHLANARLRSFLPQCHLSCSNLHVLTPRHVFTPLPTSRQGTLARSEYRNTSVGIASQDKGPVLTLLALLALRAVLHSSGPRLKRHGTCVNHAC